MSFPRPAELPLYAKLALILVLLIALRYLAVIGKQLLSPLLFGLLFAILLLPMANFFETKCRLPRSASAGISVILLLSFLFMLLYILGRQFTSLSNDWGVFKQQIMLSVDNFRDWASRSFKLDVKKQLEPLTDSTAKRRGEGTAIIGATLISLSSVVLLLVFIMLYTFFLLCYRRLLLKFILQIFKEENSSAIH